MLNPVRGLLLDRDGVINVDRTYVHRVEDFDFMPGIFDLARTAVRDLGWAVVVVTNQSGIGRGLYSEEAFAVLTHWMSERFAAEGCALTDVLFCPYHPTAGIGRYKMDHPWRKPRPGMILEASLRHGIKLSRSALVGDSDNDIAAGNAAGVGLLIKLGEVLPHGSPASLRVAADLKEARRILLSWAQAEESRH
jgi:D-glycero-D-manno-heptose 1,7-bisphosphate phosphatase